MSRLLLICVYGGLAWIVAEVTGGLAFLAFGIRLWRYEIVPLFSAITSPVIWVLAALLIGPLMVAFDRLIGIERLSSRRRLVARLGFLMTAGPVIEVLINRLFFVGVLGQPLYAYLVLPTFEGSGSLLSPLYYATLYIHIPLMDRLNELGAPFGSRAARLDVYHSSQVH
jgi:hypothetical protein